MASFAHVECGYANVTPGGGAVGLFGSLEWSETLGGAGQCPRACHGGHTQQPDEFAGEGRFHRERKRKEDTR